MTERVEQWICIKFCVKLEHSSMETNQVIQKATAMGNCWLAASSQQHAHPCITSCAEFVGKTSSYPGDSAPLQPRFGNLLLLAFSKTKITFEREEISDCWGQCMQANTMGQLMVIGRTASQLWGTKVPTLKGTEMSLSYVQCFLYLLQ